MAEGILDQKRVEMSDDPPIVPYILVKTEIENQIPAIKQVYSPAPVVSQLDGVRVKLKYDQYHDEVSKVEVSNHRLVDISEIRKSMMYDYILVKLLPETSIIKTD